MTNIEPPELPDQGTPTQPSTETGSSAAPPTPHRRGQSADPATRARMDERRTLNGLFEEDLVRRWHELSEHGFNNVRIGEFGCDCLNYGSQLRALIVGVHKAAVPEPPGLGAVVSNPLTDQTWVRGSHPDLFLQDQEAVGLDWAEAAGDRWFRWEDLPRPLVVRADGWQPPQRANTERSRYSESSNADTSATSTVGQEVKPAVPSGRQSDEIAGGGAGEPTRGGTIVQDGEGNLWVKVPIVTPSWYLVDGQSRTGLAGVGVPYETLVQPVLEVDIWSAPPSHG